MSNNEINNIINDIQYDVKKELINTFGDIENINIEKAKDISIYCRNKLNSFKSNKFIYYSCWLRYTIAYEKAVEAAKIN